MHMGNMATIGHQNLPNYKHIVINNGAHDSVGAQPTDAEDLEKFNITELAKACGYKMVRRGQVRGSVIGYHSCSYSCVI
jgi:phosphonopyruvate decarboxylase